MNIIREAFNGGERYICRECGHVVEENHYPTDMVGSAASAEFERDQQTAKDSGIEFSDYNPCDC